MVQPGKPNVWVLSGMDHMSEKLRPLPSEQVQNAV